MGKQGDPGSNPSASPPERAARPRAEDQVPSLFAEPYDKPPYGAFVDMFI